MERKGAVPQLSAVQLSERPLEILFRDEHLAAVFKPAGLATIPGRAETDSVLEALGRQINLPSSGDADPRVRVVHRLDKDTSGVLLFALNRPAQQHLSTQFQNNTIEKEYLAIVRGRPAASEGVVDAPLAPHPTVKTRMAVAKHGGRPARTAWKLEEGYRGFSLIRCFPKTGKTHQIRVHLAHIGYPLAIDPLYSGVRGGGASGLFLSQFKRDYRPTADQEERPLIDRLTLHAEKLTVIHPNGSRLELVAPLPRDFRAAVNQLSRHAHV